MVILKGVSWKEFGRKMVHFLFGIIGIMLGLFLKKRLEIEAIIIILFAILVLLMLFDYLRIERKWNIFGYSSLLRSNESGRYSGAVFFFLSAIICLVVYEYSIAIAAIVMHLFGDGVASLMGRHFGETKIYGKKTLIGSASSFIINLIVGIILLKQVIIIIAMALVASLLELMVNKLEDNLIVPIFTGLVGQLLVLAL